MKSGANTNLTVHPQAEKIRHQNQQLEAEIARLIVERDHLQTIVAAQIFAEYQSKSARSNSDFFNLNATFAPLSEESKWRPRR